MMKSKNMMKSKKMNELTEFNEFLLFDSQKNRVSAFKRFKVLDMTYIVE
jgi:hypothetical protein